MRRSRLGMIQTKKQAQTKDAKSVIGRAKQQQIKTTDLLQMMGKASGPKLEGLELVKAVADQARVNQMGNLDFIDQSSFKSTVQKTYERERAIILKDIGRDS